MKLLAIFSMVLCPIFGQELVKVKIGMMLPKESVILKPTIGYGRSAGALTLALKRVESEQLLNNVNIT